MLRILKGAAWLLPFVFLEKSEHCTALGLQASHLQSLHKAIMQAHSIPHIDLQTNVPMWATAPLAKMNTKIHTPTCKMV